MVAIRAARADDAAAIAAIYAPHVAGGTVSFETEAPDAAAVRARMAVSDGLYPWIVATDDRGAPDDLGAVLGYAYATRFRDRAAYRWTVETSIYVAGAAHGRGIGRRLYTALLDTLRAQGFTQAIGVLSLPNAASVALHEAVGFRSVGVCREIGHKFDRWVDVGLWQCRLRDDDAPPLAPRPFDSVGIAGG